MMNAIFNSSAIPVLQEVIDFTETRHSILAGNIANLDTPGYRIRDLSVETFQDRLKEAIETQKNPDPPKSLGMPSKPDTELRQVRDSLRHILFHDGSDVGLEHQVTEISKNQGMHNTAIAIMSSQFRLLQTAITERV